MSSESITFGGTENHMSPEKIKKKPCSYKSDIYSLGLVLFVMLSKLPAEHALERIRKHESLEISVQYKETRSILLMCLCNHPDDRPSIDDLITMIYSHPIIDCR